MNPVIAITEAMFATGQPLAQGEVLIWMKKYAPRFVLEKLAKLKNMKEVDLNNGSLVLGHSESGHNHVLEAVGDIPLSKAAQALIDETNDTFVDLEIFYECALVHQNEPGHATFILPPGEYIRGIREEQTVTGWQRVTD